MRLIDAEETIRSIVTTSYSENDEAINATAKAIAAIEHSPTIVEFEGDINKVIVKGEEYHRIVRCKDCKHYYFAENRVPEEQSWVCDVWHVNQTAHMGYCFKAERRSDETD